MRMLACYENVLKAKKRSLSHQTSVLDFFKSSSGPCTSPPLLLGIRDDDPVDPPTVQEKCVLLTLSFVCHFTFFANFRCVCKIAKSDY
jgi:hypothetical protein